MNMNLNGIYKYTFQCFMGDQLSENVRYFQVTAVVGASDQLAFQSSLDTILIPFYTNAMTNAAYVAGSLLQYSPANVPPNLPTINVYASTDHPGTAGTTPLPSQTCGIYTLQTPFAGRKYRGRSYIPFPDYADSLMGAIPIPTGAYFGKVADIATVCSGSEIVTTGGGATTIEWGVWHRATGTITLNTDFRVTQKWATQRRRGNFGRPNAAP